MARVRYIGPEPASVPLLGRVVDVDEVVEVDDEVFLAHAWAADLWDALDAAPAIEIEEEV